jgi:hypothetical protein
VDIKAATLFMPMITPANDAVPPNFSAYSPHPGAEGNDKILVLDKV